MKVDIDEMTDRVVEKALDEFTYNGKTIREWVELMVTAESVVEVRMVEEFEKIKKKIKNDCILHEEWFANIDDLEKCLCRIDAIVDKEISELKGENK